MKGNEKELKDMLRHTVEKLGEMEKERDQQKNRLLK